MLEPSKAEWEFKYQPTKIINHPNEKPVLRRGARTSVAMRSSQFPLAPAGVGTYQNMQGKTARCEAGAPQGHTIDLKLLESNDDRWLHYYMILGRATSLSTTLLMNFPQDSAGEYDWTIFESGPPDYMLHVFRALQKRYKDTQKVISQKQVALKIFPPFGRIPVLHRAEGCSGVYEYRKQDWDEALAPSTRKRKPAEGTLRERLDRREAEPPRQRRR